MAQGLAGLGIGGGILLGAVFFKGEIEEALDAVKDFLPNPDFDIGSPEWVSSWGDSPSEQVAQDNQTPVDETAVDSLVNDAGQTLVGQLPFDAYRIGAIGRDDEYQHRVQTETANMTPAQIANYMNYPTSQPPPHSQSLDGYAYQLAIRETLCRNISLTNPIYSILIGNGFQSPRSIYNQEIQLINGYIADPMLDWAACVTYRFSNMIIGRQQRDYGKSLIEHFMYWQP